MAPCWSSFCILIHLLAMMVVTCYECGDNALILSVLKLPFSGIQIAFSLIEEQEGRKRLPDDYISFVGLLADPRYCGISILVFCFVFTYDFGLS